jgi:hypothetical protein
MFMISHTNNKQAGVSLMLAVLILAAITAIAFSVATIVFIEIRSSGDSLRTEPNLYATLGVTEEALFQYKRYYTPGLSKQAFNVARCRGPLEDTCYINNVTLTLPGSQPIQYDNNPRVEYVSPSSSIIIPMYEVNEYDQKYEDIEVQVLPNETNEVIELYFIKTTDEGIKSCEPGGGVYPSCTPITVNYKTTYNYSAFSSTGQYELVLVNDNPTQGLSVSLVTRRVGDAEPAGLPFTGKTVLSVVANYLGLTRTYRVEIPIP